MIFIFLSCREKAHDNKEFSRDTSKPHHEKPWPVKSNPEFTLFGDRYARRKSKNKSSRNILDNFEYFFPLILHTYAKETAKAKFCRRKFGIRQLFDDKS